MGRIEAWVMARAGPVHVIWISPLILEGREDVRWCVQSNSLVQVQVLEDGNSKRSGNINCAINKRKICVGNVSIDFDTISRLLYDSTELCIR